MKIRPIRPLVSRIPLNISPSGLTYLLACPLRGMYNNDENKLYNQHDTFSTLLGKLVHQVNEDFHRGLIKDEQTFLDRWEKKNEELHQGGIKSIAKNYGVEKAKLMQSLLGKIYDRSKKGIIPPNSIKYFPEEPLFDPINKIKGKVDLLILSGLTPLEIRDYKTGSIFTKLNGIENEISGEDESLNIKENYKVQLYLYAWLVKVTFNEFPRKLTIVNNDGIHFQVEVDVKLILKAVDDVQSLFSNFEKHQYNLPELARPSQETCKYCKYRHGYSSRVQNEDSIISEISGVVVVVKGFPNGNFSLTLDSGAHFIYPEKAKNLNSFLDLLNKTIVLTFVKQFFQEGQVIPVKTSNFYVPTSYTEVILIGN